MKLTVSIVAYFKYDEVIDCVKTIKKNTSDDLDMCIYVVDNSAAEDPKAAAAFQSALAKESKSGGTKIEYIPMKKNVGFGAGHNQVLGKLDSDYHAIVNPDILLMEDAFTPIICYMEEHTDVGMLIPRLVDEEGNLQQVYRLEPTLADLFIRTFFRVGFKKRKARITMQDQDYTKPFQVPFGQGSFLVIRTDLYKKLEGFDEDFFLYLEDTDLCKRVNNISKLMYFPGATVIHKWERGSHKNRKLFKEHVKSIKVYFRKWK